jgi:Lipopolysaccharide-assembly
VRRRVALALFGAPFVQACGGYALVGKGVNLDPSIRRIGVPLFKDNSGKAGLDQKITEKVIEELLKRRHFEVVPDAVGVDAVVDGTILNLLSQPVGFSKEGATTSTTTQASRYAIVMLARVRYTKTGVVEPIWQVESLSTREEYDVGDDPSTYFDQEELAIDRLAVAFARNVVAGMLEAF